MLACPHPASWLDPWPVACGGRGLGGGVPDAVWQTLAHTQGRLRGAERRARKAEAALRREISARKHAETALAAERKEKVALQVRVQEAERAAEATVKSSIRGAATAPDGRPPLVGSRSVGDSPRARGAVLPLPDSPRAGVPPPTSPRTRGAGLPLPGSPHEMRPGRTLAAESPRVRSAVLPLQDPASASPSRQSTAAPGRPTRAPPSASPGAAPRARGTASTLPDSPRTRATLLALDSPRGSAQGSPAAAAPQRRGRSEATPSRSPNRSDLEVTPGPLSPCSAQPDGEGTDGLREVVFPDEQREPAAACETVHGEWALRLHLLLEEKIHAELGQRERLTAEEQLVRDELRQRSAEVRTAQAGVVAARTGACTPACEALVIDNVCYCISMFAPRKWAPVCSAAACMVLGTQQAYREAWKKFGIFGFGPLLSKGAENPMNLRLFGPEPGLFWAAQKELLALKDECNALHLREPQRPIMTLAWFNRWFLYFLVVQNQYEQLRLACCQLWEEGYRYYRMHEGVAGTLKETLEQREQRLEASGAA
eukprot:TRINITY_DN6990_c0_g1_i9.p1 TRINITY_DN6990_c0_g1~~TRINITY_DN6990_c0_g1_i9.p1  ORF type:complete len:540 (+),score=62.78 TRINITY_DN6990_c0_g1_i9:78-1697(+)